MPYYSQKNKEGLYFSKQNDVKKQSRYSADDLKIDKKKTIKKIKKKEP